MRRSISASALAVATTVAILIGSSGAVATQTGCGGVCSSEDEQTCSDTFQACVQRATVAATASACQKCIDDYCNCYDDCGSTCDRSRVDGMCAVGGNSSGGGDDDG